MWPRWILVPNRDLSGVGCGNLGEVREVTSVVWGKGTLMGRRNKEWQKSLSSLASSLDLGSGRNPVSRGEELTVEDNEHRPIVSPGKYTHKHVYTSLRNL